VRSHRKRCVVLILLVSCPHICGGRSPQRRSVMNKSVCAFLVFALACLVCAIPVALADPQFSERDVKGPYGFAFDGFAGAPGAPTGNTLPVASVGRFTADGHGNITDGARTLVVAGNAVRQTFT